MPRLLPTEVALKTLAGEPLPRRCQIGRREAISILQRTTGQDFGDNVGAWRKWLAANRKPPVDASIALRTEKLMGNGRPGDHPMTDILNHRKLTFSETADELIRQIAELVPERRIDDYVNWRSPPPTTEFEAELAATLQQLRENAT
jgi:hypothetical protein